METFPMIFTELNREILVYLYKGDKFSNCQNMFKAAMDIRNLLLPFSFRKRCLITEVYLRGTRRLVKNSIQNYT